MSDSRSGDSLVRQPADLEAPGGLFTQSYEHLDRGVVAGKYNLLNLGNSLTPIVGHGRVVRPCDKSYIDATAKALLDNLECVAYFYTLENVDEEIKPPYYDAALDLVTIMRECRRLIESPALFPSDNSRDQFMWFCLTASKVLKTFRRKFDSFQEEARSCLYKGPRIAYAVCVGDVWYKLRTPQVMPEKILPDWHPLKENGVKDWNKYLNNQRELEHLDESRILQRVPANGLKLVWNIKQLYGSARTRLGVEVSMFYVAEIFVY